MICNTILDAIGNTPIIRLQHLPEEDSAEILVKFEGLNVGGSIKTRTAYNMILDAEAKATKYQESLFGSNGELMKKRLELIQPIQAQVFAVIEAISQQNGFDLVIDIASNPTVLYYSSKVDYTEKVIEALK